MRRCSGAYRPPLHPRRRGAVREGDDLRSFDRRRTGLRVWSGQAVVQFDRNTGLLQMDDDEGDLLRTHGIYRQVGLEILIREMTLLATKSGQAVHDSAVERRLHEDTTPLWLLGGEGLCA